MSDAPIESMSEVPVTLTIELARLTLPLGEIASLAVGEIVRANQPIGRDAILRAGDQIVARGELVEVDGELGVRILEVTTD